MRLGFYFKSIALSIVLLGILVTAKAEIVTYPWPEGSELLSNEKYEVRVRTFNTADSTFGSNWVDLKEFLSIPRDYTDSNAVDFPSDKHWKLNDDAMLSGMKDRTMTFVSFAFSGAVEIEVTQKLSGTPAQRVEIAPKAFMITPHYFDGTTVRFLMTKQQYISVNFDWGPTDLTINGDSDGYGGKNIKNGLVLWTDAPESEITDIYNIPNPDDEGVVVWSDNATLDSIRNADIIYFPAGETNMKVHPERWELNGSYAMTDSVDNWVRTYDEYQAAHLYRGRLHLGKDNQKVFLAPGAIVYGSFHNHGHTNISITGRGIISGRKHLMHEVIKPEPDDPKEFSEKYVKVTATKEAFCELGTSPFVDGVIFHEPYHHTVPSGDNTVMNRIKILGWCFNNDGIRTGGNSVVNKIFIKTNDDYDYARSPHVVNDAVFWPGNNCGLGMLGWGNLGNGYAEYYNMHIINAEWNRNTVTQKGNVGLISGGKADQGMKLRNNVYQNIYFENPTNFLSAVLIEESGQGEGYLKDFLIKNVTTEYPFSTPNGTVSKQEMTGREDTWVEGWTYTNVVVDGVLLTWDNYKTYFDLDLVGTNGENVDEAKRCRNVTFNQEGNLYNLKYTSTGNGTVRPTGQGDSIMVIEGQKQMVSFTPNVGNRIKSITIDGVKIYEYNEADTSTRYQSYTFEKVSDNHTFNVEFEAGSDYFDLTPVVTENVCDDNEAPSKPGTPVLDSANLTTLYISWTASTDNEGVEGYEVYVDDVLKTISAVNYTTIVGLNCQTEYNIKVVAFDCQNSSVESDVAAFSTETCPGLGLYTGQPYYGTPFTVPTLDSMHMVYFDKGDYNVVFNDSDDNADNHYDVTLRDDDWDTRPYAEMAGGNIYKIANGEWYRYTVHVTQDDNYTPVLIYGGGTANELAREYQLTIYDMDLVQQYQKSVAFQFGNNIPNVPAVFEQVNLASGIYVLQWEGVKSGARPNLNYFKLISENYQPSGVKDINVDAALNVYPNPFNHTISVTTAASTFEMYTVAGHTIEVDYTKTVNGFIVNASALPNGIYFIKAENAIQKVIKK